MKGCSVLVSVHPETTQLLCAAARVSKEVFALISWSTNKVCSSGLLSFINVQHQEVGIMKIF